MLVYYSNYRIKGSEVQGSSGTQDDRQKRPHFSFSHSVCVGVRVRVQVHMHAHSHQIVGDEVRFFSSIFMWVLGIKLISSLWSVFTC